MATGCFICPIYDKRRDFEFGYEFVESAVKYGLENDLYFVFSTDEQQNAFLAECEKRFGKQPKGLLFDRNLSDCKNPVSIKKFYGLYALADKYDYIATVDCECVFLPVSLTAGEMLENVWRAGTCFSANRSYAGADVMMKCAAALDLQNDEKILRETGGLCYTWWFNDIPVYLASDIAPFFQWLEEDDRFKKTYYDWNCFDHLVYGMWRILYRDQHIYRHKLIGISSIAEACWRPELPGKGRIERILGTHWTSRVDTSHVNAGIYMQFHRDRRNRRFISYFSRPVRNVITILKWSYEHRRGSGT